MMSNLQKAEAIITENIKDGRFGIFDTPNLVGDVMSTLYQDPELCVRICYPYHYFEVFGLTDDEFNQLELFYAELR